GRLALAQPRKEIVGGVEVPPAGARGDREVLLDGEIGENLALLRHPADACERALVGGEPADVLAAPDDAAAAKLGEAHQGEEQRAFADAVAPEHGEAAALG